MKYDQRLPVEYSTVWIFLIISSWVDSDWTFLARILPRSYYSVRAYQSAHSASLPHCWCKASSLGLGVSHQICFRGTFSTLSLICFLRCGPLRLCNYPILQQPFCILLGNTFSGISASHLLDLLSSCESNKSKNLLNTVLAKKRLL